MQSSKMKKKNAENIRQSLVSPLIASIISAVIPGLGHILAGSTRQGITILFSFFTTSALLVWRIFNLSQRYKGLELKIAKAFELNPTLYIVLGLIVIIYGWTILDAFKQAKNKNIKTRTVGLVLLILLAFFIQGWEIGQIDLVSLFRDADEALPALSRVMWPWSKAIEYPEDFNKVITEVQSPCIDEVFTPKTPDISKPYMIADPTCGVPSEVEKSLGTDFNVIGKNFEPGKEIEIWWKDPINNEFHHRIGNTFYKFLPESDGSFNINLVMPYRLMPPVAGEGAKIWQIQARQLLSVGKAQASQELKLAIEKMIETIFIGMMATLFGIILAIPLSFLAARNLMSHSPLTMAVYYLIRTIMNLIRSIEPLIWAIIAVIVVGLGPFAGILALSLHSLASLAKLYSEAIESIDSGPIEAIQATGANWLQTVMYAVVPQIIPPFVSFTIYRWDINIRMSTVIGFVGGGGIGFLLAQWIRLLDYKAAGIAVWFIAITVAILDFVSSEIREKFI